MFFTKLARLFAIAGFVLGIFRLLLGLAIAEGVIGPYEAALARYTTSSSSGRVIDTAIYVIIAAVALGTLAEIGRAIRKI